MFTVENNIKVGEYVRIVNPTKYNKYNRSGHYAWLGEDLMEVGAEKKVIEIVNKYTIVLENRFYYDIDWVEPQLNYEHMSNQLLTI